ncbi:MAG: GxxExxY protein [Verrucomicrobiota bacterium]
MAKLLEKDLVYRIVGCAMKVHTEVRYGLREKTYERALCVEFRHQGISFNQQCVYPVLYRDERIDEYIPDLEVEGRVLIDAKTIENITDIERGQMMNYLRISGRKVGLIINFKHPSLQWERVVLDSAR